MNSKQNNAKWPAIGYRENCSRAMKISESSFEAYQAEWFNIVSGWNWYKSPAVLPEFHFPALHFVNFRDDQHRIMAELVFGQPDFDHRLWDQRAKAEIMPNDEAVFAEGSFEDEPTVYGWDDSNQPDDPAARERL